MKKKEKIISFKKTGMGNETTSITIPFSWLKNLGISKENRKIFIYQMDNGDILISKQDFYAS